MATAETVAMGPPHAPKEESFKAFDEIEVEIKTKLQHLRHESNKHEPQYFAGVENLSDKQLTNFSSSDLKEVRVATSAYGMHLFGKVLIPKSEKAYFHFRAFIPGGAETARLHCIQMQQIDKPDGDKEFKSIFTEKDSLEWFEI